VGMLLAPPLGALTLMTSFGLWYSATRKSQKEAADALAAKRAAEDAAAAK
jgi:HJR/Mrr/RecB family endonuclease